MEYTDASLFGTLGGMFLLFSVVGIMFIVEIASKHSKGEFYAVDGNIILIACVYNNACSSSSIIYKEGEAVSIGNTYY